jgi:hypothetical protein
MLFVLLTAMLVVPLFVLWIVFVFSPSLIFVVVIGAAAVWVILRSYRHWVAANRKDQREEEGDDQGQVDQSSG